MILWRCVAFVPVLAVAAAGQTSTTTVLSAPGDASVYGAAATLAATVTPSGATGKVTFYDGASILGIAALDGGSATLTTKLLGVGARSLLARYGGDSGNLASTSVAIAHTVTSVAAGGFQTAVSYPARTSPNGIAVADFNGDGRLDMAVSDYGGTVNILLGKGDGTFQTPVSYPAGATVMAVAAGDFNGDGNVDLAVVNGNATVSILLGNGDGSFQAPVPYSVGRYPVFVAVADFDGDGNADLAVANNLDGTVSVLIGNGDGTFQTAAPYSLPAAEPSFVAVADLDGDGKPDLVVGALYGFCILLGNGDGTLQYPVFYPYSGIDPGSIAVGDFDGDGKPDVVVSLYQFGIEVFPGKGDGTFLAPIASGSQNYGGYLVVGDFNGDGKLDVAISDEDDTSPSTENGAAAILLGNGNGTFQSPLLYSIGPPPSYALAAADFNGDGRTDLAATSYSVSGNTVGILLGQLAANPAVSAVSVSPSSGSGPSQTFTFTFSDSAGAADLASVQVLFGSDSAVLSCLITYNVAQQTLGLWNDDGSMPVINLQPGFGFVQNNFCLLNAATSSVTLSGNLMTLNVTIGFRTYLQGPRHVYGQATGASGITSGWQMLGSWTGTAATPQPVSVSPSNSIAMVQPLTFVFADANTAADITAVYININSSQSFVNSCFIMVEPPATVSLANDSNTGWLGPATLGSGLALLNSSCTVIPLQSSATLEANNFVVTLSIRLQTMGARNIYAQAETRNLLSGSQTLGAWTAGPEPETLTLTTSPNPAVFGQPLTLSATASPGFAGSLTFYDGATVLGTSAMSSNVATLSTTLLPTGARKITAQNQPNPDYALSRSNAVMQVVKSVPGTLQSFTTLAAGNSPTSVAVGDFNGDGIADLAVTNQLDDNVSVFLGIGNGNFQSAANYTTAAGPKGLTVGDFNQNGVQDLAVATGSGVSILLNNGNGTFQAPQTFATGQDGATALATGDFNNTGVTSLAVAAFATDVLMIGNNSGNFYVSPQIDAPTAGGVVVGDFNGDGNPDVAFGALQGSGLFVLSGKGDTTFQAPSIYSIPFTPAGNLNSLAAADFNGDGITDLAMTSSSGVSILLGNRDGTFQSPVIYPAGKNPAAIAVGDINGDGIADLVVTNASMNGAGNTLGILLGKGNGTFLPAVSFPVADSQVGLALGDFDGDGRVDLAVTNYNRKTVSIYLGASVAACKVAATGVAIGVADAQQMIDEALGVASAVHDLNGDGTVNVVDLEIVVSAAIGVGCYTH